MPHLDGAVYQPDDETLADAVVALGVGKKKYMVGTTYLKDGEGYTLQGTQPAHLTHYFIRRDLIGGADNFVRDWRVAGALMEKKRGSLEAMIACNQIDYIRKDASLPRELIEVCVAELT